MTRVQLLFDACPTAIPIRNMPMNSLFEFLVTRVNFCSCDINRSLRNFKRSLLCIPALATPGSAGYECDSAHCRGDFSLVAIEQKFFSKENILVFEFMQTPDT